MEKKEVFKNQMKWKINTIRLSSYWTPRENRTRNKNYWNRRGSNVIIAVKKVREATRE
jgi:hypothetical protein